MQEKMSFVAYKATPYKPEIIIIVFLLFVAMLICVYLYQNYLGLSRLRAFVIAFCASILSFFVILGHYWICELHGRTDLFITIIPLGLLVYFAVPLGVQIYRKWLLGQLTEAEKRPGWEGFTAWVTPGNLYCCLGIMVCGWFVIIPTINYQYGLVFLLGVFFPILLNNLFHKTVSIHAPCRITSQEDLSAAQLKILQMLEEGKITTQDCGELLGALYQSPSPPDSKPE